MKKIVLSFLVMMVMTFPAFAAPFRIVALGDSLTAGYGLPAGEDYATQLQLALRRKGLDVRIDNAGVSGDTTSGGVARLGSAIAGEPKPDLVLVELGANDMFRQIDPETTKGNLRRILNVLKAKQIPAFLIGMQAYPGLPAPYRKNFNAIYEDLSDEFDIPLYPFFLKGVALNPALNLGDGVHPSRAGIALMVENTVDQIADYIKDLK